MSGLSMSVSRGEVAGRDHLISKEYREGLANVVPERTGLNAVLEDRTLGEVYRARFGEAQEAYNAKQREKGHPERQIVDYLAHIQKSRQEKPSYEFVVQIGDRLTNPASDAECREVSETIYREFLERMRERFPHLDVVRAAVHVDEATPHLHVEYVPWSDGNKRGLETKNSMSGALRQMGFKDVRELNPQLFSILEEVCREHGIERVDMGLEGTRHLPPREFREACREAEEAGYPYRNDPRLVDLLEQTVMALVASNDALDQTTEALGKAERMARDPVSAAMHAAEIRQVASEAVEKATPALTTSQRLAEVVRAALMGLPTFWRDHLINPVSQKLRDARERFARAAGRGDDAEEPHNPSLAETEVFARGDFSPSPAEVARAAREAAEGRLKPRNAPLGETHTRW